MKILFFKAAAGDPRHTLPLMGQADNSLRPFDRFLAQAIHTAEQRQVRYQLSWKPVDNVRTFRLTPAESRLRVRRNQPGMLLVDWPENQHPDFSKQGFIANRSQPVKITDAEPTSNGLRVVTDIPLFPDDKVVWCEVTSSVRMEEEQKAPTQVIDEEGRVRKFLVPPQLEEDQSHWVMQLEGDWSPKATTANIDGEPVAIERLSPFAGLEQVTDEGGISFSANGDLLRTEQPPAKGILRGNNGIRFNQREEKDKSRSGIWIELLPSDLSEAEDFIDPRAAFCEGDTTEVWTQARHSPETSFGVKRIDADRYQLLLDRPPPKRSTLFLPVNRNNLYLQRRALYQLKEAPLPHHAGLLRLCEDPEKARWPTVTPSRLQEDAWCSLTDASRDGTDEQRRFVEKALSSPDFAFLEGPPGSGKTTAICEIVQQLIRNGKRVLMCASTHVAIDNVLERLLEADSPIEALRIGKVDRVDDKVKKVQMDARVDELVEAWKSTAPLKDFNEDDLKEMAERTLIMAANLTCGTTMGILSHPLFRNGDKTLKVWERPICTMPHWDVLIVDEASKTLIQEFIVPALTARKWIIVGDVQQLPPFADRADLVANLKDLVDDRDQPLFSEECQRACLLMFRLFRPRMRFTGLRWLIVEKAGVLDALEREIKKQAKMDIIGVVRLTAQPGRSDGGISHVSVKDLQEGTPKALQVAAADWLLVPIDLLQDVSPYIPSHFVSARKLVDPVLPDNDVFSLRQRWWLDKRATMRATFKERGREMGTPTETQSNEAEWLNSHTWAGEIAWRLTRLHELRHSNNKDEGERLKRQLDRLKPLEQSTGIGEAIEEIQDIGLPSILEVLQEGIGVDRAKRHSALTVGFRTAREEEFNERFERLSFQHRMHEEIAAFPRQWIYEGRSLKTANTIRDRDQMIGWSFNLFHKRRIWCPVSGSESAGVNGSEVAEVRRVLQEFFDWARKNPPTDEKRTTWEVACLTFYVKQERALSEMLRKLTRDDRSTRFTVRDAPVEIVCGTVDRFQGREADMVLLSMRNTRRIGFLDSPNRLNVAITRARQQLVVVGKYEYFLKCEISELEALAKETPVFPAKNRVR